MSESDNECLAGNVRLAGIFLGEINRLITNENPESVRTKLEYFLSKYNELGFGKLSESVSEVITEEGIASGFREQVKGLLAALEKIRVIRSITALEGIRYDLLNPKCDLNALIATYNDLDLGLFSREAPGQGDPEVIKSAFKKQVDEGFQQQRKERLRLLIAEVKAMFISFDESRDYQGLYRAFEESGCAQLENGKFAWNYESIKSAIEKELRMMEDAYEKLNAPSEPPTIH